MMKDFKKDLKKVELELIEGGKDARDKHIKRIEVLEKVKELNCLEGTDVMTTAQISHYYEVEQELIRQIYNRNHAELSSDGVKHFKHREIKDLTKRDNLSQLGISPNGSVIYPKRAILRVGMLLRDSEVAKEVRTMLLNTHQDASDGKTDIIEGINKEYTEEQTLQMELGLAIGEGNMAKVIKITTEINKIKNSRITDLEENIDMLHYNNLTITDTRSALNAIVRKVAYEKYKNNFGLAWGELYKMLNYQESINVSNRKGKGSNLDKLTEEELEKALTVAKSWADSAGIDVKGVLSLYERG